MPATRLKWGLFRVVECASQFAAKVRGRHQREEAQWLFPPVACAGDEGARALWVFISTIGELNAVYPFLIKLFARFPRRTLVLLTDHRQYVASFQDRFPSAHVAFIDGFSDQFCILAERLPPAVLILAEIPCRPSDGPCNFPFAALYIAKAQDARIVVINGWLYGIGPDCRIDRIERQLFDRDYIGLVDLFMVQDESGARQLVAGGAAPQRVVVTGNMKFDGLELLVEDSRRVQERFAAVKSQIGARTCLVAGSVQAHWEIERAVDAYVGARKAVPNLFLVFALRYPNMPGRLDFLLDLLAARGLRHVRRSEEQPGASWVGVDVLVLDTIGELRYFYGLADVTYLGVNHNVLEPLAFGRPVFVSEGWTDTYPSYPVYRQLLAAEVLKQFNDTAALVLACVEVLGSHAQYGRGADTIIDALNRQRGASLRALEVWEQRVGWELA